MNGWTTCPHCGRSHSIRADGACPRCRRAPGEPAAPGGAPAVASAIAVPSVAAPATAARAPVKPKPTVLSTLGGILGAALGVGASRYFGFALLIPGVFAILTGVALAKVGPERARPFAIALSALVGHLAWMVAGAVITGSFGPVAVDVVLMAAGIAWLVARPGLAPVIALAVLEVLATAVNGWQISMPVDGATRKALVLHVLLRLLVLAGLVVGYRKLRTDARAHATATLVRTFE